MPKIDCTNSAVHSSRRLLQKCTAFINWRWLFFYPLLIGLMLAYIVYPLGYLVWDSLHLADNWSLSNYRSLCNGDIGRGIFNSVWVSLLSCLAAACIGVPLSLLLHTHVFPGRRLASLLMYAPLLLPPLVGMFAFWLLFTDIGFFPNLLAWLVGSDHPFAAIDGIGAVILVHAYSFSVYFYALCSTALRRRDHSLIEAARSLSAGRWRCFYTITLPHLLPSIMSAAALTFMLSMGSFSAPYILANGTPFLSVSIYELSFAEGLGQTPAYGVGAALSVLGACICIAFLLLAQRWQDHGYARRGAQQHTLTPLRPLNRLLAVAVAALVSLLMIIPHLYVAIIACCDYPAWDSGLLPQVFTTANFTAIFSRNSSLKPLFNSGYFSLLALIACLAWCLLAAALLWRRHQRAQRADTAAMPRLGNAALRLCNNSIHLWMLIPLALPGTVIAFSLKRAFSIPTPQTLGLILDHGIWLLPLAYCVRCLPLAYQPLLGAFSSADPALDEAARSLGAGSWRRFYAVLLPHICPACLAASILVYVTCLGEFVVSIMIYKPSNTPIAVYMYQLMQSGIARAAAYSVVLISVMLAAVALQQLLLRKRQS